MNIKFNEKINVVFLSNLFPNNIETVRGLFNLQLVKSLSKLCNIKVICPLPFFPKHRCFSKFKKWYSFSQVPNEYRFDGVNVISPKYFILPKFSDIFHAFFLFIPIFYSLKCLNSKMRIDIVNAHYLYPDGVAAYWACKILNIPIVISALGSDVNYYLYKPLISEQIRYSLNGCSKITSVSKDLGKKISILLENKEIKIIQNGVNLSLFKIRKQKDIRKCLAVDNDKKIILYVGRLSYEKGLTSLIEAISLFNESEKENIIVIIVGDGPMKSELQKEILRRNLNCFSFLGFQNLDIVSLWMSASDLLCLPSLNEGCPNVIIEALSSGKPVVASKIGGIPELVKDGINGFLFNSNNSIQLCEALKCCIKTNWDAEQLRDSINGRTWDNVAREFIDIYKKILGG